MKIKFLFSILMRVLFGGVVWILSALSFATIPVVDWISIAKEGEELATLQTQVKALLGENGFGKWGNTDIDLQRSQWNPESWAAAVKAEGDGLTVRYQQLRSEYDSLHPLLDPENIEQYEKGAGSADVQMFQEQLHHNQASQALASGAYEEINQDFKNLHELGVQIGDKDKDPDLKHAVDLNSRVEWEVGNIAVQELRMLSLLNQQLAQNQATVLEEEQDASAYLAKDFNKGGN